MQDRIVEEYKNMLGDKDDISSDDLSKLVFLDQFLLEVNR